MPHVNGSSDGDDLGDADEIKVFKHDEECEEEKKLIAEERQSDSLTEDKSSLVTEGESQVKTFFPPDFQFFWVEYSDGKLWVTHIEKPSSSSFFCVHTRIYTTVCVAPKIRTKGFFGFSSLSRL
jgi:hypothetical protein